MEAPTTRSSVSRHPTMTMTTTSAATNGIPRLAIPDVDLIDHQTPLHQTTLLQKRQCGVNALENTVDTTQIRRHAGITSRENAETSNASNSIPTPTHHRHHDAAWESDAECHYVHIPMETERIWQSGSTSNNGQTCTKIPEMTMQGKANKPGGILVFRQEYLE